MAEALGVRGTRFTPYPTKMKKRRLDLAAYRKGYAKGYAKAHESGLEADLRRISFRAHTIRAPSFFYSFIPAIPVEGVPDGKPFVAMSTNDYKKELHRRMELYRKQAQKK